MTVTMTVTMTIASTEKIDKICPVLHSFRWEGRMKIQSNETKKSVATGCQLLGNHTVRA